MAGTWFVAVIRLHFGLEITNHTHNPVQIKVSVKKKKKKRKGKKNLTPRPKRAEFNLRTVNYPIGMNGWSEGGRKKRLSFSQGKKRLKCFWVAACSHYNNISTQKHP